MEKYIVWYILLLKTHLKRFDCYLQFLGMLFMLLCFFGLEFPQADNVYVGVYCGKSSYAVQTIEKLKAENKTFHFVEYKDEDILYKKVVQGKLECAFIFENEFDEKLENEKWKKSIKYLCTPITSKGEVAKETLYATLFQIHSVNILKKSEEDVFGTENLERQALIFNYNQKYLQGNELFCMETLELPKKQTVNEKNRDIYPIRGMIGLCVFLTMFLGYGRKFEYGRTSVTQAMGRIERHFFSFLDVIASGTLLAIAGVVILLFFTETQEILLELNRMLLLVLLGGGWIVVFGSLLKNENSFFSCIAADLIANLLVCPIFIDISIYFPAVEYIRWGFPLGIYLKL